MSSSLGFIALVTASPAQKRTAWLAAAEQALGERRISISARCRRAVSE